MSNRNKKIIPVGFVHRHYLDLPRRRRRIVAQVTSVVLVVLAWEITGRLLGSLVLAPFSEVVVTYIDLMFNSEMFPALVGSLKEMFIGFGLALAFALPVGIVMGRSTILDRMLDPWVSAIFVTATSALLPLLIILLGINFKFRISIVILSCVWHMLLTIYHGAKHVDQNILDVAKSFGASRTKTYTSFVFPALFPYFLTAIRMGIGRSVQGIILAEMYILIRYGSLLRQYGNQSLSTAPTLGLVLTIVFVAYGSRVLIDIIQQQLVPWADVSPSLG